MHHERGSFSSFSPNLLACVSSSPVHFLPPEWLLDFPTPLFCSLVSCLVYTSSPGTVILRLLANPWASLSTILLLCPPITLTAISLTPFALEPPTHATSASQLPAHSSVRHHYLPASIIPPMPNLPASDNQWSPCHCIQQTYLIPLRGLLYLKLAPSFITINSISYSKGFYPFVPPPRNAFQPLTLCLVFTCLGSADVLSLSIQSHYVKFPTSRALDNHLYADESRIAKPFLCQPLHIQMAQVLLLWYQNSSLS